jgi:hypothetical protein
VAAAGLVPGPVGVAQPATSASTSAAAATSAPTPAGGRPLAFFPGIDSRPATASEFTCTPSIQCTARNQFMHSIDRSRAE